jgi:hypothetical protein
MPRFSDVSLLRVSRTNALVPPSVQPITMCVAVASLAACAAIVESGKQGETLRIACRMFSAAFIGSLFSMYALRRQRTIFINALIGTLLAAGGAMFSLQGLLRLLTEYDSKSAATLFVSALVLSIITAIFEGIELRIERRFPKEPGPEETPAMGAPSKPRYFRPDPLAPFRTISRRRMPAGIEPIALCAAAASFVACTIVAVSGKPGPPHTFACRCFAAASIWSLFATFAVRTRRALAIRRAFGVLLGWLGVLASFMGLSYLVAAYDLKAGRNVSFGAPILLIVTVILAALERWTVRRRQN